MSASESCKESKSIDDVCEMNNLLQSLSTTDDNDIISICANCGKEGANNICNKCKVTTYCNAVCKKVHKKKHKKECEEYIRLATEKHNEELRIAAKLHDIELFKEPPSQFGDCSICFLRIPTLNSGSKYQTCCGKTICSGCVHAPVYDDQGNEVDKHKCPFCRISTPYSDEEIAERYKSRIEAEDPIAIYNLGVWYRDGERGFTQDMNKALELWHQAGELGYANAYCCIGHAYDTGQVVVVDKKKATYYYELAAMGGDVTARHNLGCMEEEKGNIERALKHYVIAGISGLPQSLETIQKMYLKGQATKEDYMKALLSYQTYLDEIKSKQRDEAAAFYEKYRYY